MRVGAGGTDRQVSKTDAGVGSPPRGRIPAGCDGLGPSDITGVVWLAEGPGPGGGHGNQPEKGPGVRLPAYAVRLVLWPVAARSGGT
jgi:hypothetical protein